jgi:hypothetical protein
MRLHTYAERHTAGRHACASCHEARLHQALVALDDTHQPLAPALNGSQI